MKTLIPSLILAIFSAGIAQAQTTTAYWTGAVPTGSTSGWGISSNVGNWTTGAVPDENTDVVFDLGYKTGVSSIQIANNFVCNDYTISSNYVAHQIRLDGTMNINGNFYQKFATSGGISLLSNGSNSSSAVLNIGGSAYIGVKGDYSKSYYCSAPH